MNTQRAHIHKSGGFSLIELMVVIAIIAILAGAATQTRDLIDENKARTGGYELLTALSWARSEALKRNNEVRLVANDEVWEDGWTIEAKDKSGVWTPIGSHDVLNGIVIAHDVTSIVYNRHGRIAGTPSFEIDISSTPTAKARCLTFELNGRPRVVKATCPA